MKSPAKAKPSRGTSNTGGKPGSASSITTAKPRSRGTATDTGDAAAAEAGPAVWPFKPGSQGDHKAIEAKPVQRAGWNARQFRI